MSPKDKADASGMGPEKFNPPEIPVQLSESIRREAEKMASREGISLEDFILYAVAERMARLEPPDKA